ncbi:MAG TPA: amidase [Terrimicrobiaceae bacterium]
MKRFELVLLFLLTNFLLGCAIPTGHVESRDRAFIRYWPPPSENHQLRLAVKDLIDVKGEVTTAGSKYFAKNAAPASRDAECLEGARRQKVWIVGKTNLTEFGLGGSGMNEYFGTPKNRFIGKRKLIPGGSSSGSAVAVATGAADVAFGTDTAGSVRVPAACCGILGLKTTLGLVPVKGVFPISANLDTVGPLAKDIPNLVRGMDLLQEGFAREYNKTVAAYPSPRRITIGRLYVNGTDPAIDKAIDDTLAAKNFRVVRLDKNFESKWKEADKQARTLAVADAWWNNHKYLGQQGISATTKASILVGEVEFQNNYWRAKMAQRQWQNVLRQTFRKVDFIALPTLNRLPPKVPFFGRSAAFEALVLDIQNTEPVNLAGNPALAMPILLPGKEVQVTSLQLVGPRLSEARLVNVGRLIESH